MIQFSNEYRLPMYQLWIDNNKLMQKKENINEEIEIEYVEVSKRGSFVGSLWIEHDFLYFINQDKCIYRAPIQWT